MSYITDNEVFCMSYNSFNDLVNQCKIVDNKYLRMADVDISFISSNILSESVMYKNNMIPERSLVRFKFLEILIRLSYEKYYRNKLVDSPK
jgi:hypothetical protein